MVGIEHCVGIVAAVDYSITWDRLGWYLITSVR
jgi:hypothetical protein